MYKLLTAIRKTPGHTGVLHDSLDLPGKLVDAELTAEAATGREWEQVRDAKHYIKAWV